MIITLEYSHSLQTTVISSKLKSWFSGLRNNCTLNNILLLLFESRYCLVRQIQSILHDLRWCQSHPLPDGDIYYVLVRVSISKQVTYQRNGQLAKPR